MSKPTPVPAGQPPSGPMQPVGGRRRWLYGAVAGAATLAGLSLARWKNNPDAQKDGGSTTAKASNASTAGLWELTFEAPGRQQIRMQSFAGRPLLLNFWATWCPPCVEEFPLLDRFYQENSRNGWQVLGLAVDKAAAVESFLQRLPVQFPIALAGMSGIDLSKTMGNLGGGLPFTIVLGSAGKMLAQKIGRVSPQELAQWGTLR